MVLSHGTKALLIMIIASLLAVCVNCYQKKSVSQPPFIDPNVLHTATSQFQVNLIFNENRNIPIFFAQYSKDFTKQYVQQMIKGAFRKQPDISFGLLVDCRRFQNNLNKTLNICYGFDSEKARQQEKNDLLLQPQKRQDNFFRFDFMSPNPTRIKQKGHLLSKNHEGQNLRKINSMFNDQFLAKILRNQIPDFVSYIQDSYDLEEFLQRKNQFASSKRAKLLYFDQNLQAPLFLKKIAAILDGKIKVGVFDDYKMAKKFNTFYDSVLLMEYNYIKQDYDTQIVKLEQFNQLSSILQSDALKGYINIKKHRDMMLDFEHKDSQIYNFSTISQIGQLISFGRIIVLEISSEQDNFKCPSLKQISVKYDVFLNYICFSKSKVSLLSDLKFKIQSSGPTVYIIDRNITNPKRVEYKSEEFNIYQYLPQTPPRQQVSAQSEAQLCIKTGMTSKRDVVFYWYNQKQNKNTLKLLQYFNSLPEVTSLIYFCQISVPNQELIKRFQLNQNCLFTMMNPTSSGQLQKLQFKQALEYVSIKMFLRQLSIKQMMKVYEQKLSSNQLTKIQTAKSLADQCFSQQCIIALIATHKFRKQSELQILKELKLQKADSGYNFVWIDGSCHWDIAKQLKFLNKKETLIDRSYIFYYKQKTNQYSLMKSVLDNKYWVKKDVKRWIKTLKEKGNIKGLRYSIDMQDKKCVDEKEKKLKEQRQAKFFQSTKGKQVNQNQL